MNKTTDPADAVLALPPATTPALAKKKNQTDEGQTLQPAQLDFAKTHT